MKTTFKLTTLLLIMILIGAGKTTLAIEKTKKYHESWPSAGVENVQISNKFGEVKFKNDGGSEITIDVLVKIEGNNERKVSELIDKIDVSFSKSGSTVKAETSIESNYNFNGNFSIDYVVNVPSEKNLAVENKYGNVVVNQLTGNGNFDVQYGSLTAVGLKGINTKVLLAYGKAKIDETANIEMQIKYSNITMGETGNMRLDMKYSTADIDKAKDIQTESRYDKINVGELVSLTADTKYSQVKIGKLMKHLQIGTGYGGIKVESIDPGFESIIINNSYGNIYLGLSGASYTVDARCEYCGISYPQDRFKGNRMKEDTSYEINGKIGNTGGGKVKIDSRYGEIKLGE